MPKIEQEYETQIESKYHQKDFTNLNPQESKNYQATTIYTPHIIEKSSSMNRVYRNSTNKVPPPKKILDSLFFSKP